MRTAKIGPDLTLGGGGQEIDHILDLRVGDPEHRTFCPYA